MTSAEKATVAKRLARRCSISAALLCFVVSWAFGVKLVAGPALGVALFISIPVVAVVYLGAFLVVAFIMELNKP